MPWHPGGSQRTAFKSHFHHGLQGVGFGHKANAPNAHRQSHLSVSVVFSQEAAWVPTLAVQRAFRHVPCSP